MGAVQRDGLPDGEPTTADDPPGLPGGEGTAAAPPVPVLDEDRGDRAERHVDAPAAHAVPPGHPANGVPPVQNGYAPFGPATTYPPGPPPGTRPPQRSGGLPPVPKRTHRWGLGAYLLAEAVFLLSSLGLAFLIGQFGGPSAGALALGILVPTVLAAGTALLITYLRGNGPRVDLGLEWSWRDVGLGVAFGISGLVLTIPASLVYISIVGPDATSAVGAAFGNVQAGPVLALVVLLAVAVVGPACEEILYRGLLWGGVEKLGGRWVAFGVSTLLFALAHFEFQRTPLLLVVAIPIALARLYTGRLLASIVAHQINNLLPAIVLALGLLGVVPMV
ncbi:lysostaphin resistance A-like protein [Pseudonocardia aurantiaca]|uniref:CPBP family intramembrane glutamic endopeptidase n=1 Tax=Pseudonocardia aurantiaca TaxID=75290 RepID=A0ABW4FVC0_9PSEU